MSYAEEANRGPPHRVPGMVSSEIERRRRQMQPSHLREAHDANLASHDASDSTIALHGERSNLSNSRPVNPRSEACRPGEYNRVPRTPGRSKRPRRLAIRDEGYLDELEALFVMLRSQGASARDAIWAIVGSDRERRQQPSPGAQGDARHLILMVCEARGLTTSELVRRSKVRHVVESRWIAARVLQGAGYSTALTATLLSLDHSAVIYGIRRSSDRVDLLAVVKGIAAQLEEPIRRFG